MRLGFAALAVVAGVATALQATVNAGLSKSAGLGPALVTNTLIVLIGTVGLWLASGASRSFFPAATHWTLYLGGIFGFTVIAAAALVFPKLGAAWAIALMVFGQCLAALAIDHYGLLGVDAVAVTPQRLVGLALVAAGAAVFRL